MGYFDWAIDSCPCSRRAIGATWLGHTYDKLMRFLLLLAKFKSKFAYVVKSLVVAKAFISDNSGFLPGFCTISSNSLELSAQS